MFTVLKRNLLMTYEDQYDRKTEGDPFDVIPIKNVKEAKNTLEICLSNREINKLIKFEFFVNLEIVWLNNNFLSDLDGLKENFRLKEIYLKNNKFEHLNPIIFKKLKNLVVLDFEDNKLFEFEKNLKIFKGLKYLKNLNLIGNPMCNEIHFRLKVILEMPYLQILNGVSIKEEERIKAKKLQDGYKGKKKKPKKSKAWQMSANERILFNKYKPNLS